VKDRELLKTLLYDIRKEKSLEKIHALIMVYQDDNCDDFFVTANNILMTERMWKKYGKKRKTVK